MPEISFTRRDNGVVVPHLGEARYSALSEADLQSPSFLETVNGLLAAQRLKAWDHEAREHQGKGEMFFGAALVRTADNRFYLAANIHQKNALTTRDCAEANAINQAAQDTPMHQLAITDVWFMGGKGNLSKQMPILPEEQGRRNCPCGSCLDVMSNTRLQYDTRVHMLPLNNGDMELAMGGEAHADPAPHMIVSRNLGDLLPHEKLTLSDADGRLKDTIAQGRQWLQEPHEHAQREPGRLPELEALEADAVPAAANKVLMETLHQEMMAMDHKPLNRAELAVVRTHKGQFYLGTAYVDGRTMGMPSAVLNAVQNARRESISDVYLLQVDLRQRDTPLQGDGAPSQADVVITMPDGETRDRIWKARAKHEAAAHIPAPVVHIMTLTPEHAFDPSQHMHSFGIQSLLPYAFTSPKHDPKPEIGGTVHEGTAITREAKVCGAGGRC